MSQVPIPPTRDYDNIFTYHPANANQLNAYQQIREAAKSYSKLLDELCPAGRELSVAQTNLEQVMFWANASIARAKE